MRLDIDKSLVSIWNISRLLWADHKRGGQGICQAPLVPEQRTWHPGTLLKSWDGKCTLRLARYVGRCQGGEHWEGIYFETGAGNCYCLSRSDWKIVGELPPGECTNFADPPGTTGRGYKDGARISGAPLHPRTGRTRQASVRR